MYWKRHIHKKEWRQYIHKIEQRTESLGDLLRSGRGDGIGNLRCWKMMTTTIGKDIVATMTIRTSLQQRHGCV
jgi:hypothetical protein